ATWSFSGPVFKTGQAATTARRVVDGISRRIGLRAHDYATSLAMEFLRTHRVRVLMGEYLDQSLYWVRLAKTMGIRAFGHAHGYDISQQLQDARWRSEYLGYNELDGIITPTSGSRQRLVDQGVSASKIHVVSYGIDVPSDIPARNEF